MAGEIATAFVSILPSFKGGATALTSQLTGQAATAGDTAGKAAGGKFSGAFGSTLKIGGALVAAFAVTKGITFFKDAIQGASDLNETVSKVGVIFGDQAPAVEKFASTATTALGQTTQQALDAAATFGVFGKAAGLAGAPLTAFSTDMVALATDMASFSNTSVDEAVMAIGSALRGEAEPIRSFGVLLDDATLRARAFEMGLIDTVKNALTPQQKALAAQAEIMAQTSDAQGDFARTSDGVANKQKIAAAKTSELATKFGTLLLPAYSALLTVGIGVVDFFTNNAAVLGDVAKWVGIVAGVIGALFIPKLIAMGVAATINAAKVVAGWVATAAGAAAASVAQGAAVAKMVAGWVLMGVQSLLAAAKVALAWLIAMGPIALVIAAVVGLVALIIANFDTIKAAIGAAWEWVKQATSAAWAFMTGILQTALDWISGIPGKILGFLSGMWTFVTTEAGQMKDAVIEVGVGIVTWFTGLPGALVGALSGLGMQLYGVGQDIIEKLWAGLKVVWSRLTSWFTDALDWLTGLWPFSPAKHGPLRAKPPTAWGENIMKGLAAGMESQRRRVQGVAGDIAGIVAGIGGGSSAFAGGVSVTTPRGVRGPRLSGSETSGRAGAKGYDGPPMLVHNHWPPTTPESVATDSAHRLAGLVGIL